MEGLQHAVLSGSLIVKKKYEQLIPQEAKRQYLQTPNSILQPNKQTAKIKLKNLHHSPWLTCPAITIKQWGQIKADYDEQQDLHMRLPVK